MKEDVVGKKEKIKYKGIDVLENNIITATNANTIKKFAVGNCKVTVSHNGTGLVNYIVTVCEKDAYSIFHNREENNFKVVKLFKKPKVKGVKIINGHDFVIKDNALEAYVTKKNIVKVLDVMVKKACHL